jgi:hypothetical protein
VTFVTPDFSIASRHRPSSPEFETATPGVTILEPVTMIDSNGLCDAASGGFLCRHMAGGENERRYWDGQCQVPKRRILIVDHPDDSPDDQPAPLLPIIREQMPAT